MSFDAARLYNLLPAVYRIRDTELADRAGVSEGPLKSLLSIIAGQVAVIEEDLDQLYDNQFIETCAEWVVPYIGDLVGARGLLTWEGSPVSQRAQVANTLAYRRRKGTAAVLEQLARDITGWDANVVEFFQLLATNQYMNHVRPGNLWSPSLRNSAVLEGIDTPFDHVSHTAEMRNIGRGGKYNIPNIGIYLWRIGSFSATASPAYRLDDRRYLFDALGKDTQLFNRPQTEEQITHLASPFNVPMPITRRALDRTLEDFYRVDDAGTDKSLLLIEDGVIVDGASASPPSGNLRDAITVCNLSDQTDQNGNVIGWAHTTQEKIAIDPVLGRIVFPQNHPPPVSVRVTYQYGFSAEMGGGEYGRTGSFTTGLPQIVRVPQDRPTIQEALDALTDSGVVEIQNNDYFFETPAIHIGPGRIVELRGADERRPILVLSGPMSISGEEGAELRINGLLVSGGSLLVPAGANALRKLTIQHCTLVPGPVRAIGSVPAQPASARVTIELANAALAISDSIVGPLRAVEGATVTIANSIVDATAITEVAYAGIFGAEAGAPLNVANTTVLGKVHTLEMTLASNTIFLARLEDLDNWTWPVWSERTQAGCVRFSFIPSGSKTPRLYHCQPEDETSEARTRPVFTSQRYGDPGYFQLSDKCPSEIREGADEGSEMGAFHNLFQPQRIANLRTRLDEYLRFGLEVGIFKAS